MPLHGFRFLQVGDGATERRAGTLLALLGAEVVALLDQRSADRVLADPGAPHHRGRLVVVGGPETAGRIPSSGVIDGTGQVRGGPASVDVSAVPTGRAGWSASGALALTGPRHGPGRHPAGDQAAGLAAAAAVLALLTALGGRRVEVDGPALVGERAALVGLHRNGAVSPGGSCRLLAARDGWLAVNLARRSDLDLVAAWLGAAPGPDPWLDVTHLVSARDTSAVVAAGRELGLAVTPVVTPREAATDAQARARGQRYPMTPFVAGGLAPRLPQATPVPSIDRFAPVAAAPRRLDRARVVDFSSLWAGPLATSLLALAGSKVVKVESTGRPDGARAGDPRFFDLLNGAKRSVALDFTARGAPARLAALVDDADLVVEASRPRAFEQLGLDPETWRAHHPAGTWLSITAYGRTGPGRQWAGFGDDAAVAGGLVIGAPGEPPQLCGDAYADPVTGLHAAVVAAVALVGSGGTFDVALREVVNHLSADGDGRPPFDEGPAPPDQRGRPGRDSLDDEDEVAPRARSRWARAPALGQDNEVVLPPDAVGGAG